MIDPRAFRTRHPYAVYTSFGADAKTGRSPLLLLLCVLGTLCVSHTNAQDLYSPIGAIIHGPSDFGALVQPTHPVPIVAGPPGGMLIQPGQQIGTASPERTYVITGAKEYQWWSTDRWVQITPVTPDGMLRPDQTGWTHWGADPSHSPAFDSVIVGEDIAQEAYQTIVSTLREDVGDGKAQMPMPPPPTVKE